MSAGSPSRKPEPPKPTVAVEHIPAGLSADALWGMIAGEPETGVSIVTLDGLIVYANQQAARLFGGENSSPSDFVGKNLRDLAPSDWVRERLAVLRRVLLTGKPVLLRAIWRGWQQHSWINFIDGEPEDEPDGPDMPATPAPPQFLIVTRSVSGDGETAPPVDTAKHEFVDANVVDLGPLDVLTPRELEVLALIGQGLSLKETARALFRSVKTVDKHRTSIGAKLSAHDRVQLAEIARRAGLSMKDAEKTRV